MLPNFLFYLGYDGLRQSSKLGWKSIFNFIYEDYFPNSPIWFLLSLFFVNILFYLIYNIININCKQYRIRCLILTCIFVGTIGYVLGRLDIELWMFIDCSLTALPFFCIGYILKNYTTFLYPNKADKYIYIISFLLFIYIYYVSVPVNFVSNKFIINSYFSCVLRCYIAF